MDNLNGYFATVLCEDTAELLRSIAVHEVVHCHHVTMAYKPTQEVYDKYQFLLGRRLKFQITHLIADEKCQAAVAFGVPSENRYAHVTISCVKGVSPAYSNALLISEASKVKEIHLEAVGEVVWVAHG